MMKPTKVDDFNVFNDPQDPEFGPLPESFNFTPAELNEKMARAAWEYAQAIRHIRRLERARAVRIAKTMVILSSNSLDLVTNERLREHLRLVIQDPKFRWTKELFAQYIYIEHQKIMDEYNVWERVAKTAEVEHEMWSKQLGWHQSQMKRDAAELYTLRGGSGGQT